MRQSNILVHEVKIWINQENKVKTKEKPGFRQWGGFACEENNLKTKEKPR